MNPTRISSLRLLRLSGNYHAFFGAAVFLIILGISGTAVLASTITGLDFPGSDFYTTIRFRFLNPLPIYPATYIWRVSPRFQFGYYTTFFWGNDPGEVQPGYFEDKHIFHWYNGGANTFYGAHPFPIYDPDPSGAPSACGGPRYDANACVHKWEIATDDSNDYKSDGTNGGPNEDVVFSKPGAERWYTQALVAYADQNNQKHTDFYWDLPDLTKVISHVTRPGYGDVNPPVPALTFGDAAWDPGYEVYNGILRGIRVYSTQLSIPDLLSEASSPLSATAGKANIWYLNMNPTPDDISDKSGAGHDPSWIGSQRPSLYSATESTPPPADKTPPVTTISLSGQQGKNGWYTGPVKVTLNATDPDGPSDIAGTSYKLDKGSATAYTGPFTISSGGVHTLAFGSTDRAGNTETLQTQTIKIDATPPNVTCRITPNLLWPPNHKLIPVTATVIVSDVTSGSAGFVLKKVTINEADDRGGDNRSGDNRSRDNRGGDDRGGDNRGGDDRGGDDHHGDDQSADIQGFIIGQPTTSGLLRAERSGSGNGRTYTLTYQGKDLAGNTATCSVSVVVPKDRKP